MAASTSRRTVAVVTPYSGEGRAVLAQCAASVRSQTVPCTHIVVGDGDDRKLSCFDGCERITLPSRHGDNGNTPRAIGSILAAAQGADAIAYLDADNWFHPEHVERMLTLHESRDAAVCTATRRICHLDGSELYVDRHESDGRTHVDTSCLFLFRPAFAITALWHLMPRQLSPMCDRVVWKAILARGYRTTHCIEPTVYFRSKYRVHYDTAGRKAPAGTMTNAQASGRATRWWRSLPRSTRERWQKHLY